VGQEGLKKDSTQFFGTFLIAGTFAITGTFLGIAESSS
jgi:hypothetical protein